MNMAFDAFQSGYENLCRTDVALPHPNAYATTSFPANLDELKL
jgi:hypothetical protein